MNKPLEQLLKHPNVWQASRNRRIASVISTGYESLDARLHDHGWPLGATTELLGPGCGLGELRLLLPALHQQRQRPWLVLVAPPFQPYAPALAAAGLDPQKLLVISPRNQRELLWSADQALRSGSCGAVLTWSRNQTIGDRDLRKLQQAAHQGNSWHVLFRNQSEARNASPSALRIRFESDSSGALNLQVLKQRGGWSGQQLQLSPLPPFAPRLTPEQLPVHLGKMPTLPRRRPRPAATAVSALARSS